MLGSTAIVVFSSGFEICGLFVLSIYFPPSLNHLQDVRFEIPQMPTPPDLETQKAEGLKRKSLAGHEALLGAQHPHTLSSVNCLAVLLDKRGKLDEAGCGRRPSPVIAHAR